MGTVVPAQMRAAAWGFTGIFVNLAYFLGPFIATELLSHGILITQGTIVVFLVAALVLLTLTRGRHDAPVSIDFASVNPWSEFKHWVTLSKTIWPALAIGLVLGIIDATFYTVGTVWTEKLTLVNPWGVWFLPLYLLPSICLGIPLSNWNIKSGKKKLAEKFLGLAGIFFILMAVSTSVPWQLAVVCLASSALAVCYPLLEGVYTDFLARMGSEKKDMIGLTGSVINFSYIIWPVFAGIISSKVGERLTFSWLGVVVLICAIVLLLVTPKKIKLPQTEIQTWE
jgi:MFS family permease